VVPFESERREFTRIRVAVPVKYKYLCLDVQHPDLSEIWEGSTSNISSGGFLLRGVVPQLDWLPMLLSGRMQIGVNILLPSFDLPVKALCRVAWMEGLDEESGNVSIGLLFQELTREQKEEIVRYIIKSQIPG
jgi:c-di-GMP-binding flagellar brake protein YcgR